MTYVLILRHDYEALRDDLGVVATHEMEVMMTFSKTRNLAKIATFCASLLSTTGLAEAATAKDLLLSPLTVIPRIMLVPRSIGDQDYIPPPPLTVPVPIPLPFPSNAPWPGSGFPAPQNGPMGAPSGTCVPLDMPGVMPTESCSWEK